MIGRLMLAAASVLTIGGVVFVAEASAPAPQSGPTLNITAGQGEGVVKMQGFVPSEIRVAVGTTVTWSTGSEEEHNVVFLAGTEGPLGRAIPQPEGIPGRPTMLNPLVFDQVLPEGPYDGSYLINSGVMGPGQPFSLTFSKTGTFQYLCALHERTMRGVVEVVEPGTDGITTQQEVDTAVAEHMPVVHGPELQELLATRSAPTQEDGPDGARVWRVRAGTSMQGGHLDIDAFLPERLTVRQGDTIIWKVDHDVPHTITFLEPSQPPLETVAAQLPDGTMVTPGMALPDPSVTPRLVNINRQAIVPSPTYDGVSLFSSGQIGGIPVSPRGLDWTLTFDTPGTFDYVCLLHLSTGMVGQITVEPR